MVLSLVYPLVKYVLYFLLAYIIYLVYTFIISPYLLWRKYKKYSNVYTSDSFTPILGDLKHALDDKNNGRPHYYHKMDEAKILKNYDLKANIEGTNFVMLIVSQKAMKEFVDLEPHAIDRVREDKGLGSGVPDGWVNDRTDKKTKDRRKNIVSLLNFNKASKYIPMILQKCDELVQKIEHGKEYHLMNQMSILIFDIITAIMFGRDTDKISQKLRPYKNPDGTYDEVNLRDFQMRMTDALIDCYYNPLTSMFPYLNKYKLCNPYKRNQENLMAWKKVVKELIAECTDENSICSAVVNIPGLSEVNKLDDLMTLMVAGSETTARAATSLLYFLNKYPKTLEKLKEELKQHGVTKDAKFEDVLTMENVQNFDYLNCVIKESLRLDTPVVDTFDYYAYKDTEICGVPIPKGTQIKQEICGTHFNDDRWLHPKEFIPERFDPDSEFYQQSVKEGKSQESYSRRSFGHGIRNCPGQTLSILELKVIIPYLVTKLEFKVDEELLNREAIGFAMGTNVPLTANIYKVDH